MSGQPKKVSLFKQRINEIRSKVENKDNGFPVAPKIIEEQSEKHNQEDKSSIMLNEEAKESSSQSFLHSFTGISKKEEQEIVKIQEQNWKTIDSMSQTQRQKTIKFLRSQLPQSFLRMLEKGKNNPPPQKEEQKEKEVEKTQEVQESEEQSWLSYLKLNIEKDELTYTEQESESLVDLKRLSIILGSENNQSQVVGGSLLEKWAKSIQKMMTSKTRELLNINGIPLHGISVSYELFKLIKLGFKKLTSTTYRSVFIQLCSSLVSTVEKISFLLKKEYKKEISGLIKTSIDKIKTMDIPPKDAVEIKDSLNLVVSYLQKQQDEIQWNMLRTSIDAIIQLSLLEVQHKEGYWLKALHSAQKCSDLQQLLNLLSFLYQFINKFIIQRNKRAYIDLTRQRDLWSPSIMVVLSKFCQSFQNIDPEYAFEAIFLARFIGGQSWQEITVTSHLPQEKNLLITGFLLFNTLSDLKASSLSLEQIQALNHVFEWISITISQQKTKLDPNFILSTLLELFLQQQQQYYSQLNQDTLQTLLTKLVLHSKISCNKVVSEQQIRTLTKNYNYSSFGNHAFTYLLLSLASTCTPQKEDLILRSSILPCWKQFYQTASLLTEFPKKREGQQNQELKDEIVSKIKDEEENCSKVNYLIEYLC